MFSGHSCNMTPLDSVIRFTLATVLVVISFYISCYYLLIISIFLYITAYKKFCFAYFFLKINEKLSINNHYLTFLPKYNPSAVFIFNLNGETLFKNEAASSDITCIHSILDINIADYKKIILNDGLETVIFECHDKHYQIQLQGIKKEKFLLAYLTDITEIIDLSEEIEETQREVIYTMGEIGETRSKETGNHVKRVALYSKELALLYGLSLERVGVNSTCIALYHDCIHAFMHSCIHAFKHSSNQPQSGTVSPCMEPFHTTHRAQDKKLFSPVHLNHAEKGTQECNVIRLLEDDRVAFFTSRDIVAGEELCFDYGSNFWNGREDMKI